MHIYIFSKLKFVSFKINNENLLGRADARLFNCANGTETKKVILNGENKSGETNSRRFACFEEGIVKPIQVLYDRAHLRSIINGDFVARTRAQGEILPPRLRLLVLGLVSKDLYVDRDPFRGPAEKLVNAHGIGGIPAPWGADVLSAVPRSPGAPVRKFASRASRLPRNALLVQGHLEAVVRHGAVPASDELQDHVLPARVDARHSAAAAEPRDLQDPSVHVFEKREIVTAACISHRSIFPEVFGCRRLGDISI